MTEKPIQHDGRRRKFVVAGTLFFVVALWLVFKFFEPYIVGPFGWTTMPSVDTPVVTRTSGSLPQAVARADAWLADALQQTGAPAVSAAVSVDGELIWAGAVGYADLEREIVASPDTVFRIGSSSKAVTSVAMATLIAKKIVDLDAPAASYMPDLTEPLSTVTTRQAMSHTGGVRDYGICLCFPMMEYFNQQHYRTQRDSLRPFENDRLLFPAGEGFSYSSYGYNLVGGVVESVTGNSFGNFLDETVFGPLDMEASRAESGATGNHDAVFYDTSRLGLFKKVFHVDNTIKLPSGGLLSTPSDMVRLGYQMIEPTLFDTETRDLLLPPGDSPPFYGLGWRYQIEAELLGKATPEIHHHGTALGSTSQFSIYPEYGMVVSVMMNSGQLLGRGLGSHRHSLAEIFAAEIDGRTWTE